ncbi:MAG: RNA-binding S4 domain-containing protein [Actinomycetota bacterium]
MSERVRVDKWLWAVRVYKTRSVANDACASGRVTVNDEVAKPATKVGVGDVVAARRRDRTIIYEVGKVIEKRVSAALAAECVVDHSPPPPARPLDLFAPDPGAGQRRRGDGRPTKRNRRRLDRLQGRDD